MANNQRQKKQIDGMGYRELQRYNSERKAKLPKTDQKLLKQQGYRNVGWTDVLKLHEKINALLTPEPDLPSLEDLFLAAERIGNKYQTQAEITVFNQKLADEADAIADLVDIQFPEPEFEFVDYSQTSRVPVKPQKTKRKYR
jgi:hypothetical protein